MISYNRKGLIYSLNKKSVLMNSHSQLPVVDVLEGGVFRIYFATRNCEGQSNISFIEVDANNPQKILYEHNGVILELGKPGTFDDSGIMPTCIVNVGGAKYLYYVGWSKCADVPYSLSLGVALSYDDGETFHKFAKGPIVGQSSFDPFFTGTASVTFCGQDNKWRMWYMAGTGWARIGNKMESLYDIKYTESDDGVYWHNNRTPAVELNPGEGGLAKPTVLKIGETYHMWYSFRGELDFRNGKESSYKIGHATSDRGYIWKRLDDVNLGALEGWDSDMQAYPHIIEYKNEAYLFYNGNGFGASGFGYALLNHDHKDSTYL